MKRILKFILVPVLGASANAQTWTNNNGAGDFYFSTPINWSPSGAPASGSALTIARADDLTFDLGGPFTASGITVNAGVAASLTSEGFGNTITIGSGGVSLGAGSSIAFNLPVNVNSTQTWNIGGGSVVINDAIDVQSNGSLTINLTSGSVVSFISPSSPSWSGVVNFTTTGSVTINTPSLNVNNVDNITLNGSAVQVIGNQIQPIPEPSTFAFLASLGAVGFIGARRRKRAIPA